MNIIGRQLDGWNKSTPRLSFKITLLLIFLLHDIPFAQDTKNISLIGRWAKGPCSTVFINENYTFISNGAALDVLDVENDTMITLISRLSTDNTINDIHIYNDLAICAYRNGIMIVDIKDPCQPVEICKYPFAENVAGIFSDEDFVYLAVERLGLRIMDFSDPVNPSEIGWITTEGHVSNVFVKNKLAYLACYRGGLRIVDVENPEMPKEINSFDFNGQFYPTDVFLLNGYAYVISSNANTAMAHGKLHILDVSNTDSLYELSRVDLPGDWSSTGLKVVVKDSLAYVLYSSDAGSGLLIVDVRYPDTPSVKSNTHINDARDLFVKDGKAFVAVHIEGMHVYDVSDPENICQIADYETAGNTNDIAISQDIAYMANFGGGLIILDVSDPGNPTEISRFTNRYGHYYYTNIFLSDDKAFLTATPAFFGGFHIVDISDSCHPVGLGWAGSTEGYAVFVSDEYAYVADRFDGLRIFDVSNASEPAIMWDMSLGHSGCDIVVRDSIAYLAAARHGVYILDVRNPQDPIVLHQIETDEASLGVFVKLRYLYIADGVNGLVIYDIEDPSEPIRVNQFNPNGFIRKVYVDDRYAYLADASFGLRVIDIQSVDNLKEVGYFQSNTSPYNVEVDHDLIYLSVGSAGFYILKNELYTCSECEQIPDVPMTLYPNYPNPFNSSTTICFSISNPTFISLKIYDIRGREIDMLLEETRQAGSYGVKWNAKSLPSGIYLYRLEAGEYVETKKLILQR